MDNNNSTQVEEIYEYMLNHDFINQAIATEKFRCSRLAAIIHLMKKKLGIQIESKLIFYRKESGRLGRYSNYWLKYKNDDATNQTIG